MPVRKSRKKSSRLNKSRKMKSALSRDERIAIIGTNDGKAYIARIRKLDGSVTDSTLNAAMANLNDNEGACCHGGVSFAGVFDEATFGRNFGNGHVPPD